MTIRDESLKNLIQFKAADLKTTGVIMSVRVAPDDKEWLKQQKEGISYHTRKAISLYRQIIEQEKSQKLNN